MAPRFSRCGLSGSEGGAGGEVVPLARRGAGEQIVLLLVDLCRGGRGPRQKLLMLVGRRLEKPRSSRTYGRPTASVGTSPLGSARFWLSK